jgi:hypothetical protein
MTAWHDCLPGRDPGEKVKAVKPSLKLKQHFDFLLRSEGNQNKIQLKQKPQKAFCGSLRDAITSWTHPK